MATIPNRMEGKVAVLSGVNGGIGAASARRLAAEGAKVVLADIDLAGAERTAEKVRWDGGSAHVVPLDLAEEANIAAVIDAAMTTYGRIDTLFNNAADTRAEILARDAAIEFMDADVWDQVFRVNTRGTMLMIKHALPHMLRLGGGSIINTSSGASLLGDLFLPAYASSKAAINILTQYVAAQYGKRGIRCNVISPGVIMTDKIREMRAESLDVYGRHNLTPDLGEPEDIAASVAMLASDEGRFINAQIIRVDGGISTHFSHVADVREQFEAHVAATWGPSAA